MSLSVFPHFRSFLMITLLFRMIGFYHAQTALHSDDVLACISFANGASAYLQAAKTYPEDDEFHACK